MKLNKLFAVALAVVALTSCEDNKVEDYPGFLGAVNTAKGVTVSLPTTYEFNENLAPATVPVYVTGETNGKVVVTVKVSEVDQVPAGNEKAILGEHYNVTSYTVNIPEGETEGFIEIYPIWVQGELNDDRVFNMEIVSVQGADIVNAKSLVTIVNIDDPYTAMFGKWKFKADACTSNAEKEYTLTIGGPDPSDTDYYGKELYAFGLAGMSYVFLPLNFEYDDVKGEPVLSIQQGTFATTSTINFGFTGVVLGGQTIDTSNLDNCFGPDIPMVYSVAADGTETIAMEDMNQMWYLVVAPYPALNQCMGQIGGWKGITLTR